MHILESIFCAIILSFCEASCRKENPDLKTKWLGLSHACPEGANNKSSVQNWQIFYQKAEGVALQQCADCVGIDYH